MKKLTAVLFLVVVAASAYMAYAQKPQALQHQNCCMDPPPCPPCD